MSESSRRAAATSRGSRPADDVTLRRAKPRKCLWRRARFGPPGSLRLHS